MALPLVGELEGTDWLLIASIAIMIALAVKRYFRYRSWQRSRLTPILVYPYGSAAPRERDRQADERRVARTAPGEAPAPPTTSAAAEASDRADATEPATTAQTAPPRVQRIAATATTPSPAALQEWTSIPRVVNSPPPPPRPNGNGLAPSVNGRSNGSGYLAAVPNDAPRSTVPPAGPADPESATLQLLPGRLDVVVGPDQGLQIRFVKQATVGATQYTLGRAPAVEFEHVQIRGITVSRLHAAVRYEGGRWTLVNLSTTNPTRVGGRDLTEQGEAQLLADGDRIELGEVVLQFAGSGSSARAS